MNDTFDKSDMKIMIIDDSPPIVDAVKKILSAEGYKIYSATSGIKSLELISQIMPDLILLDIMMPEMDGFTVCKKLKENPGTAKIPVIFLTSKSETDDMIEGFKLGCVDYIVKPFRREDIYARVKTHLYTVYLRKEVEKQSLLKGVIEMAGATAHELNQPLSAILMSAQLVMTILKENDPLYKKIKRIEEQSRRMAEIIKRITYITKYEVKDYIDGMKIVDINKASGLTDND